MSALQAAPQSRVSLEASGITKRYPGVVAVDDVDFAVSPGEIHALVGENGAGKSTLIRVFAGVARPDAGEIHVGDQAIRPGSSGRSRSLGVAAVFQELALVPHMTVAENVVLGNEPSPIGAVRSFVSRREANEVAEAVFSELDVRIDPGLPVAKLSTAEQQLVEIGRAIVNSPSVLIMDEPTSSLSGNDVQRLLEIIDRLRADGTGIIFVSHRLSEVLAIADRVSVMREGRLVATRSAAETSEEELIEMMTGRARAELFPAGSGVAGDEVLRVEGLSREGAFSEIEFELHEGEILGFAGLMGAGRTEVMRAICGIDSFDHGSVLIDGQPLSARRPKDAIRAGLAYVPEDRKGLGLFLNLSGYENATLPSLDRLSSSSLVRSSELRELVEPLSERLGVRGSLDRPARTLSGGNQQKIALIKWLLSGARVLILDEPTRGIDIGAKHDVYQFIRDECARGTGVVLVSSELPELMHLADRMLVMSGGRIYDRLHHSEFDEGRILRAAFAGHTVEHVTHEGDTEC